MGVSSGFYPDISAPVSLRVGSQILIEMHQSDFSDIVIWTPVDEELTYHGAPIICIQSAQIHNGVTLQPGENLTGSQTLTVR